MNRAKDNPTPQQLALEALKVVKPIMAYLASTEDADPDFDKVLGESILQVNAQVSEAITALQADRGVVDVEELCDGLGLIFQNSVLKTEQTPYAMIRWTLQQLEDKGYLASPVEEVMEYDWQMMKGCDPDNKPVDGWQVVEQYSEVTGILFTIIQLLLDDPEEHAENIIGLQTQANDILANIKYKLPPTGGYESSEGDGDV